MLTDDQKQLIEVNLKAYLTHFQPITIEKSGQGFLVFQEGDMEHIQYCYSIHYLNGWLYGAVQARCGQIRKL